MTADGTIRPKIVCHSRVTTAAGLDVTSLVQTPTPSRTASGAAGQVWRALDLLLERNVAVKLLRPDAAGDQEARARFRAEARNASRLSHPGVAQVYDYGEDGSPDLPFLVMELVDGPSLAEVLAAGPLDPGRTMDLIAQVGDGLHAAHSGGLVHRDIKPANLLITGDGQVKITDFGIASVTPGAPSGLPAFCSAHRPTLRRNGPPGARPHRRPTCTPWAWWGMSASPGPRRSVVRHCRWPRPTCGTRFRRCRRPSPPRLPRSWPRSPPRTRGTVPARPARWPSGPGSCAPPGRSVGRPRSHLSRRPAVRPLPRASRCPTSAPRRRRQASPPSAGGR